jgi:glycosyltransferase involved in cell wall biosynthesis
MDVHPEIGALSGEFANPLIRRFLTWVDTRTCLRATTVVVLSEDMKTALVRRDAALEQRVLVINNFDLPDFDVVEAAPPLARGTEDLRIVFAGNIGRYQGLERIVRAVLECDDRLEGVKLVLMGEGAAKQRLVELAAKVPAERRDRVAFVPHGSVAETRALLGTADLGLVSLAPQVISYAYPSKTATYLSQGLPLLVDVEMSSQLARMVEKEGVGRCLPRDSADLVSVLVELVSDQDEIAGMAARARAVWAERFAAGTTLPRWSGLLAGVLEGRG